MKNVALRIAAQEDPVGEAITASFDDADLALLQQYCASLDRLRETALLQNGLSPMTGLSWTSAGMALTGKPYSNAELHELLHVLRPVLLANEAASYENASGLLGRRFKNKNLSKHLKAIRFIFDRGELASCMQVTIGDQKLFDDSILRLWLNGVQYHTDTEKAAAWAQIEKSLTTENARALVMNQLHGKVSALFRLEQLVKFVLDEKSGPATPPAVAA